MSTSKYRVIERVPAYATPGCQVIEVENEKTRGLTHLSASKKARVLAVYKGWHFYTVERIEEASKPQ